MDEVQAWETASQRHLEDFNHFASVWRLDIPSRSRELNHFSNTRTSETTRAVETLATMMFRIMTSQQPNFQLYAMDDTVTDDDLFKNEVVLRTQHRRIFWPRKLLRALRSLTLFGTVPVEIPWTMEIVNGEVVFEATDFIPRSLLQLAFDVTVPDIKLSDFHTVMDFVTPQRMRQIAKSSPGVWDQAAIEMAIAEGKDKDQIKPRVRERLTRAGYRVEPSSNMILSTRWGLDKDGREVAWAVLNEKFLVRGHANAFPHGKRPFLFASMVDFELEPYGYGVGNMGKRIQAEMDANRNRNNDLMTFAQFHMWKLARSSGARMNELRIRPFKVVELDNVDSLQPLRPDLAALKPGLDHENILRDDFRAVTGATAGLQAQTTDATATEASITQNEAVRRIAVTAEIVADELIREFITLSMKNNRMLDTPIWTNITGDEPPRMVHPANMRKEIGVEVKITTDKDFRPERTRRMIEFFTILSSVRQRIPADVDLMPIVREITRGFGINPKEVIKPQTAFDRIKQAIAQSQNLAEAGPDPGQPDLTDGGEGGNTSTISTPVGDVAVSP